MSPLEIGFISFLGLLILLGLSVPIGVALGLVSFVGLFAIRGFGGAFATIATGPYDFTASWTLAAIPLFLLMGSFANNSGLTNSLFATARAWLSFLPGGLAVATNFASAGFAAASGSSMATTASVGRLAVPEMLRSGYDPKLATSVVASSGTLGSLIPPSVLMILYCWLTQQSVGQLFIAGIVPGFLTAFAYTVMITSRAVITPEIAPPPADSVDWRQRLLLLLDVWPMPLLIVGVIGALYSGLATATESAAVGAFFALLIGILRRGINWNTFRLSVLETLESTASIFFIAIGATLYTRLLAISGIPLFLAQAIEPWAATPVLVIIFFSLVYLVLGMFLDPLGIMLLSLPVLAPVFEKLHFNMIWMGILIIKFLEIGLITPPVGLNAFILKSVVGESVSMESIFYGLFWFIGVEIAITILLIAFPEISLFLPNLMG